MASLALKGVAYGADKIPDKAFEKIPYAGQRYFKEKEEEEAEAEDRRDQKRKDRRQQRRDRSSRQSPESRESASQPREQRSTARSESSADSESDAEKGRAERRARRRQARKDKRGGGDGGIEMRDNDRDVRSRGYESDRGPGAARAEMPYFPPPPRFAVNEPMPDPNAPSNPDYPLPPGFHDDYYSGHPQEQQQRNMSPYAPPPQDNRGSRDRDGSVRSSTPDRYRPGVYNPPPTAAGQYQRDSRDMSPNPQYPSAVAVQPDYGPSNMSDYQDSIGYNSYQPPVQGSPQPYHRRRQGRFADSPSSGSRDREADEKSSRTGSRVREEMKKHKDVGASALGALAGGIIGNELSGGRGKMGLLIGAALGGIGGNVYERKHEEQKSKRAEAFKRGKKARDADLGYDSY